MNILCLFTIHFTLLLLFFVIILILIEIACYILRRIDLNRGLGEKIMKWVEVLDWLKNDRDE